MIEAIDYVILPAYRAVDMQNELRTQFKIVIKYTARKTIYNFMHFELKSIDNIKNMAYNSLILS